MKNVCLEIPEQIAASLKIPYAELQERLRMELAIRLYQKGILGFGKARELSGLNKLRFQEILAKEDVSFSIYHEVHEEREEATHKALLVKNESGSRIRALTCYKRSMNAFLHVLQALHGELVHSLRRLKNK